MKATITISILVFSTLFGWIGEGIGHGFLSLWSIILSTVGAFFGVWVGYKISQWMGN